MSEISVAHAERLTTMEVVLRELQKLTNDHERRLRTMERAIGYGSGALGMSLFLLKLAKVI